MKESQKDQWRELRGVGEREKKKESERDSEIRTGDCGTRWEEWHASSAVYCHGPSGEQFRAQDGVLPRTSAGRGQQRGRGNKQDNWQYIQHENGLHIRSTHGVYIHELRKTLGSKLAITHADMSCAYALGGVKVHMSQSDQLSLVSYPGYIVLDVFDQEPLRHTAR